MDQNDALAELVAVAAGPSPVNEPTATPAGARRARAAFAHLRGQPLQSPGSGEEPREVEQMRQAMLSRAVIEQAKGIAMERFGISAEAAWAWLVRSSQERNVKLRDVAQGLVDSVSHRSSLRAQHR